MIVVDVYNLQREKVSEIELKDDVFNVPIRKHVLHQVVVGQTAGHRSGTSAAKGRSQVKSSGAKLYRQKGTGRARSGSASSPTRRGGGVAFGPVPRKYHHRVPKKVKKAALRMALTDKVMSDQLIVVNDFNLAEIKTKTFVRIMKEFEADKALIVTLNKAENLEKSSRNVQRVKVMRYEGLNTYDVLKYTHLFVEQPAIEKIQEALAQ
ncbi:MAG: 50S ribosomal protein L4 [Deltaproteobacteria bacterium]|nr:MAG: 50S ribosomal protein L4 [Deltaproteobacteria bacterium]